MPVSDSPLVAKVKAREITPEDKRKASLFIAGRTDLTIAERAELLKMLGLVQKEEK